MTAPWPIQVTDHNGVARLTGKAQGVPPISGALGVLQIPVPFNAPGLATGIPIGKRSPVAPEIILAAWFDVDLPWDVGAVTPQGDIYTPQLINDDGVGLIALASGSAQPMHGAGTYFNDTGFRYGTTTFFWPNPGTFSPFTLVRDPNSVPPDQPWYYCVSQDGTPSGGDPGASHGHALLNILLARPA